MRKFLQTTVLTMLLVLISAPAWALGLGQLQVKSKLNEPLLAEIPVISADPMELQDLQVRLAAPDTFLRVGLPLPDRMVSDLQFKLVYDTLGQPVIRVTSPGPVAMPMMTFLLEVDWGEGRLVREYSVLLTEPDAVAAANAPVVEAPVTAPSNTIVREPDAVAAAPMPQPVPTAPAPAAAPVAPGGSPVAAAAMPTAVTGSVGQRSVVSGDTLSGIAASLRTPAQSVGAVMAALLRANPDAFINGDPNLLRSGAVLQLPDDAAVSQAVSDGSAEAMQAQVAGWRGSRSRPTSAVDVASAVEATPATSAPPRRNARRARDARLEIMPAAAGATAASATRSGGGGQGDAEMTQQLQEARETIASRDAEVAELQSRVTELEALQKQQAQLIQMKDGQLATAQQQLNQRQQATPVANEPASANSNPMLWVGVIGLGLLAALALAWLLRRRRPVVVDEERPSFAQVPVAEPATPSRLSDDIDSLFPADVVVSDSQVGETPAASVGLRKPSWIGSAPQTGIARNADATDWSVPAAVAGATAYDPADADPVDVDVAGIDDTPPAPVQALHDPLPDTLPEGKDVFDAPEEEHGELRGLDAAAASMQSLDPADAESAERIALARTYLELEDDVTARMLLEQVIDRGGVHAEEARRMLDRFDPS